jgi:hypothetical protein
MSSLALRFRAVALLAAGALAVHQLRYLLAYGHGSHHELALQGHAYLAILGPALVGALMLAAVELAVRMARAGRRPSKEPGLAAWPRLWALASACLLFIYVVQEWLEGQIQPGHPAGPAGIIGHGGWLAIALAAGAGLVVAFLLRGAGAAIERAARANRPRRRHSRAFRRPPSPITVRNLALDVLACFLAGRGPPLASI